MNKTLKLTGIHTYDTYIKKCNNILNTPNVPEIKEWLDSLRGRLRPATIRTIKSGLKKSILETYRGQSNYELFASVLDRTFQDIKVDRADAKVYSEKVLNKNEIHKLIKNSAPRTSLIIETLNLTGLRITELLSIRRKNCCHEGRYVFIRIVGKNRKERRIFIPVSLFNQINEEFRGKTFLFETINGRMITRNYAWKEISRKGLEILGKRIHPHTFRHTFATRTILKDRKDIKAVSQYLGHASTSITADMYLHSELKPKDLFK
ncbi:tyrosine-type recombinase/integrase [Leptospira sarikeiensis]|uniref:Integrase n=1 Tax=Leptospira sarikeiensis TaxID=2484943 RepID=A0A4R9KHG5_9LEPT|nr:tyrosine-type recombinase/integrase [Leptospira sarikeiensis]TGL65948.1 integrase [Leptospira sarikeiensis]